MALTFKSCIFHRHKLLIMLETSNIFDIPGNGELDFGEFCDLMSRNKKDVTSHKAIEEAFKVFDKDGKGILLLSIFTCDNKMALLYKDRLTTFIYDFR